MVAAVTIVVNHIKYFVSVSRLIRSTNIKSAGCIIVVNSRGLAIVSRRGAYRRVGYSAVLHTHNHAIIDRSMSRVKRV